MQEYTCYNSSLWRWRSEWHHLPYSWRGIHLARSLAECSLTTQGTVVMGSWRLVLRVKWGTLPNSELPLHICEWQFLFSVRLCMALHPVIWNSSLCANDCVFIYLFLSCFFLRIRETRSKSKILIRKIEEKGQFLKPSRRWKDNPVNKANLVHNFS
jgi:hypothetical protein